VILRREMAHGPRGERVAWLVSQRDVASRYQDVSRSGARRTSRL
jgi:hypothetical protein